MTQDELAETQVASPGYAGTKHEIDSESYDFDIYDYWDDLQYGDDEYWDYVGTGAVPQNTRQKRKREMTTAVQRPVKRRMLSLEETGGDNVRFVSIAARNEMAKSEPPRLEQPVSFALLPDWKERFADDSGLVLKKSMPEEMKKAAEGQEEDTPPKKRGIDAMAEDEEEWEDENDEDAEDMAAQLASLDPEALKAVLRQKLGDAGLEGMDEEAFMQSIAKMLSGDDGAEDAADDLANSLLGKATQGNDTALSGWLSQQGVSLDAAEDEGDDETSSVATPELLPETAGSKLTKQNMQVSPPDSAIEIMKGGGATSQLAMHPSSPSSSAKKRPAPVEDLQEGAKKRKRVTFDVPPSSQSTQTAVEDDEIVVGKSGEATDLMISEDTLMPEPTIQEAKTKAAETKAANAAAVESNGNVSDDNITVAAKPTPKSKSKSARQAQAKADNEAEAEDEIVVSSSAPVKQTRKRKAQEEGDDVEDDAPTQRRKHARKTATPAVSNVEPAGKRTRSTRAKVGK